MKFLLLFLVPSLCFAQREDYLSIQAPIVNVRAQPSLTGAILKKAKRLDVFILTSRDKQETIDGVTDYWYKVKTETTPGYVFGHLTSLKQQGRISETLTFEGCDMGDYPHISMGQHDFGLGENHLGKLDLCAVDNNGESIYKGNQFRVVSNQVLTHTYCGGGSMDLCDVIMDSIIEIELMK